ncbi:hypothetical protein CHLRE_05g248700v5 [Chlamydomonas reinhardtii]|uniref:Nuclease associated modular domain-containing protein n=1 Tax=Chlamydomonas reinhardtii TaxID=3055 RepID=A0A2K3DRZ3_CHLRE|nr:uncharacterized protein CHLRE_05g248700v5 [Chlamydomonas reinhardtii]PNW83312.1 hypothetical protein CHLRE_05g248700v5 [Chlamydomonas reinhardtii]
MAGEEERCIPYEAAYIMDPTTGSLPNKHRVAPVEGNTCVLVVSVYRTDLTYDDIVGAIVAKSVERRQPFSLAAIEIERPTAQVASTRRNVGNTYGSANKGRTLSQAAKDAMSAARKGKGKGKGNGKPMSQAAKDAISAAKKGKPLSQATKDAMSAAHKGKPLSQATKDAMSAAHKGKPLSQAAKDASLAARKGKPLSQAHKDTISAAKITCLCGICKTARHA